MNLVERLIPSIRTRASEAASETAFALLDALWVAPVGIAFFDDALRFLQVNEALARIDGVPVEGHLGRRLGDLTSPAYASEVERIEERLRTVLETGRPILNHAVITRAADGAVREWLTSCYPVRNAVGGTRGVCALVSDATADRDRALAIERSREDAERSARRVTLLQEITAALSAAHDPGAVAEVVVAHLRPLLGAATASVRALQGGRLLRIGERGGPPVAPERLDDVALDLPIPVSAAVRREEPVWLESKEAIAARFPAFAAEAVEAGLAAAVALPLAARGRTIGALEIGWAAARALDLEERAFVLSLAEQCAQALDRAQLYETARMHRDAAQRSTDRLARLQAVTAALAGARTVDEVARVVVRHAIRGLGAHAAAAYVPDGGRLRLAASEGVAAPVRDALATHAVDAAFPVAQAFRTGQAVWSPSVAALFEAFPAVAAVEGFPAEPASFSFLPLRFGGAVHGVVAVALPEDRRTSPDARELLATVAAQCGQALERARLYEAEQALRSDAERTAALLDAILGNAPIGVGVVDRELRFVQVNPVLAEMNGLAPEAHLGRTPRELLPGIAMDEIETRWRRILETGVPELDVAVSGETPAAPGKLRHWLESWYPVRAGGAIVGLGVLVREVTAEREAEEFQRHVLGVVGHDLRNPLSAVVTATKLLLAGDGLGEREARLLARTLAGAERMDRIIRMLLDYARVRGGQGLPLHRRSSDLAAICRTVCDEIASLHPGREVVRRGDGDGTGEWDPDRIAQVLANLLGNALDYSAPGTAVEVRWTGGPDEVAIEVANAGKPIPPEVLPRLFEPFRRGERDRPGGRDGLGLGLFIARAIVVAHGGRIEARSAAPEGTVFTVVLPRRGPARAG